MRSCSRRVLLAALLVAACGAPVVSGDARAASWPQWYGPTRNGVSPESSGWNGSSWPAQKLWQKNVGEGCTSPVMASGKVYVSGWSGGKQYVCCLDAASGNEVWRQSFDSPPYSRYANGDTGSYAGMSSTPAFDEATGYLYTHGIDGQFHCWNANSNGSLVWSMNIFDAYGVDQRPQNGASHLRDYGCISSPLVLGDRVILEVGSSQGTVMGFNKRTGSREWTSQWTEDAGQSCGLSPITVQGVPCIANLALTNIVIIRTDGGHEGETVASQYWRAGAMQNIPTIGVSGSSILVTSHHEIVSWSEGACDRFDVGLGGMTKKWRAFPSSKATGPTIYKGYAYQTQDNLYCIDFSTGEVKWGSSDRVGTTDGCGATAIVAAGDDKLIFFGENNCLYLAELGHNSPGSYVQLAKLSGVVEGSTVQTWPHIALSDGKLLCKDRKGNLACLSLGSSPQPSVTIDSFTASPGTIDYGAASTLSWTASNATSVTLDGQSVNASGSTGVSPAGTATYTLVAQGTNGPVSREVTVTVNPPPPEAVRIDFFSADPAQVQPGASSTLAWGTTNATSVTLGGQGVDALGSTGVSPASTTTYTLEAQGANGPVSRQVTVTVTGGGTVTLPLKVNCGTNEYEVAGWERDDPYVTGGADHTFGGDWDTTAPDSAPADVYKTCRHQSPHSYSFPVPDGDYTVRLHLGDAYGGDRRMDYRMEGVLVIEDLDVDDAAGGAYRALVRDIDVTVADGNGLQIECTYDSGVDVFECGIEILEAGGSGSDPVLTTVSIDPQHVTMYASTSRTFDADTLDQYGNAIASSVTWSVSGGGTVSPTTGPSTVFTSNGAAGEFTLTASAEGLHATATITVAGTTDSDSDGMDDGWETRYFGDLTHDGSEDTDADGATDYEEFLAGTDPTGGLDAGMTGFGCAPATGCAGVCLAALLAMFAAVCRRRPCTATERRT